MAQTGWKASYKAGHPPGTLVHVGDRKAGEVRVLLIDYDENSYKETEVADVEECFPLKDLPTVTWINVDGLHDVEVVRRLGEHYNLHPLVLEDVLNTTQRPKFEDFDDYLFLVLRMADYDAGGGGLTFEQVSIVLGPNYVFSFLERDSDEFEAVRDRLRNSKGRLRKEGADFLVYSLLDAAVDDYFVVIEGVAEEIESVEDELVAGSGAKTLHRLNGLKKDMIYLLKSVWPLREVVGGLQRGGSSLVKESTNIYLRDVYDHMIRVIETVEAYRDTLTGMLEIYLSIVSNRMNEVMKVLTIIATIFIPLTCIAGVYGMNFRFMPELVWPWGYPAILAFMLLVAGLMLVYFKKKRWF